MEPYKLKPIRTPMRPGELVDVPIDHPFRYHRELVITHRHSQQWQNVLMVKGFPRYNLLAEPLQYLISISGSTYEDYGNPPL